MDEETIFWAEQISRKIIERRKFRFTEKPLPEIKNPSIKSSSSLSGVLHIGRLSDIIRGEAVYRALRETGRKAQFIYVTEDMDPLRKVPAGIPEKFNEYIGMPVSDVPDPEGCHESYGVHFKEKFLRTFVDFLTFEPTVYSMRDEYKKGNFTECAIALVKHTKEVKAIIDQFKENPSPEDWSPWKPICDRCGKIQTTVITGMSGKRIEYVCRDYEFEKTIAKGCGHEGTSDLGKANGKLVWKSEWAAQWKRWNVVCEGAGKEYNAPNSAWFVNAEICERILGFPMPEPIFYEHLLIDGTKMSASVGNVVYPHEWLEVARPESLKLLYMKKLAKTRSFSWKDLPLLETELDKAAAANAAPKPNEGAETPSREDIQLLNLYRYSAVKGRAVLPVPVDYSTMASLAGLIPDDKSLIERLSDMGIISAKISKPEKEALSERISHARSWVEKYAPELKLKFAATYVADGLPKEIRDCFLAISNGLKSSKSVDEIQQLVFDTAKSANVKPKELFNALYRVVLAKETGPKFGSLVFVFGKDVVSKRLQEAGMRG